MDRFVDIERRETSECIVDAPWAPGDFSHLESRIMRRMCDTAGLEDVHLSMLGNVSHLYVKRTVLYARPNEGTRPRSASRRKHKRNTKKQFVFLPVPNISFAGTTTGRISQSDPARYDIMASGRIVRTPRD